MLPRHYLDQMAPIRRGRARLSDNRIHHQTIGYPAYRESCFNHRVTFNESVTRWQVVTLSTLNRIVSPAAIDVVQPVSVELCPLVAVENKGFADAVIVSATVGG
jgi:hypothetical protein